MVKQLCLQMISELDKYKQPKEDLFIYYVEQRLNKSLLNYSSDLDNSLDYLNRRKDPLKIVRKINK